MDSIETKLFGRIKAPCNLGQLIEITEEHAANRMNVYMWRGQETLIGRFTVLLIGD